MVTTTETGVTFWEIQGMNVTRIKDISMFKPVICKYNVDFCIIIVTAVVNNECKLFVVSLDNGDLSYIIDSKTTILMNSKIYASDNLKNIAITLSDKITVMSN
ncbi:hypothetical protein BMR1_03g04321 [Babesia microti strain RI]|uniref:Uncharacterized protein n=1 Tax=Babesia microti (strain RI) TaxID=1133968 RepID=A0A1R4ACI3_BABMR|nr:hypothetical protein BMR1_03g04321 [Babesia microti strain RI]SJK86665.1 hypothetical protein BMR1_03g04321 [Babesia microti strain RI]|eukprot:XP_021338795.1 hypothetical protein BMR1_03g04321 [Babesia microti strain RI]